MRCFDKRVWWGIGCLLMGATTAPADWISPFTNQAGWQQAVDAYDPTQLANVSLANSDWLPGVVVTTGSTVNLVISSNTAASNGMTVTEESGYDSRLDVGATSTLGHIDNNSFVDQISKYGSTTFTFSDPIYAFGGNFDVTAAQGLMFIAGSPANNAQTFSFSSGQYDGFLGFISGKAFSQVTIDWVNTGQSACPTCYGASFSLSGLQAAVATPEPMYFPAFLLLVVAAACRRLKKLGDKLGW